MKYKINLEDAQNFFEKIDLELGKIEVKGDSVEHLYLARLLFKKIFESLEEIKEESEREQKGD
jgi:hypothetical protein